MKGERVTYPKRDVILTNLPLRVKSVYCCGTSSIAQAGSCNVVPSSRRLCEPVSPLLIAFSAKFRHVGRLSGWSSA